VEQTWRWWGPNDIITLAHIRQVGASGIVTALHDIPTGELWSSDAVAERKRTIETEHHLGLRWSVVESLPIHERIKLGEGDLGELLDTYRQSMRNLAQHGVTTICYNFMPVLDWARTQLRAPLPGGGSALRFNVHEFAAFDCYMLQRDGADGEYSAEVLDRAKSWFAKATEGDKRQLLATIMAGLPGAFDRYDIDGLKTMLAHYRGIDRTRLRENLAHFLREIIPTAEEVGIRMAIHPDDPPRPLLGLPRICSSAEDIAFILDAVPSSSNGLTFCTGSLGASYTNDLRAMVHRFAPRIYFAHLRNVTKEKDGSFMEADHLGGDNDMVGVVKGLLGEQKRRHDAGEANWRIPFRPDHGHELLDDVGKATHPGYPAIGRMRGLAEIRGVMTALAAEYGFPI
jgi:mannonate dehydratase